MSHGIRRNLRNSMLHNITVLEAQLASMKEIVRTLPGDDRKCINCDHISDDGRCRVNGNQQVPEDFLTVGCEQWEDCIPF